MQLRFTISYSILSLLGIERMKTMNVRQLVRTLVVSTKNLLLGGNLASFSLLHPKKMVFYATECLFYLDTMYSKRGITEKNVFEVLKPEGEVQQISLVCPDTGGTWFNPLSSRASDIVSLCLICQILKPKVVFEIGTLKGYTAYHFALNTPEDAIIYTLDLPQGGSVKPSLPTTTVDDLMIKSYFRPGKYWFQDTPAASKIVCLYGDSATFDYSEFEGKVDFFFIDGAHSYEYVRNDTMKALYCCHSGSVIAWHDFGRRGVNGVRKWILELSKKYEIYAIPGGTLAFMVVP
ncbi:MAG: hypothetical protein DRG83_01165 [Deltaproteobacteria bacterium]|nr:MAG: hypothetical protein DRG83_01165 [Deltaproteobacteria bacterium]